MVVVSHRNTCASLTSRACTATAQTTRIATERACDLRTDDMARGLTLHTDARRVPFALAHTHTISLL